MHCFVCYEETTETCACACKAHVHRACLLKTIETRKNIHCSICAQPIQNVVVQTQKQPSLWVIGFSVVLAITVGLSSLASILLLALAIDDRNDAAFYDLLICCASSVFLAMFASHFLQKLLADHDLIVSHEVYAFM
jgi:hypothetical protein